jgi:hypothetical protein
MLVFELKLVDIMTPSWRNPGHQARAIGIRHLWNDCNAALVAAL